MAAPRRRNPRGDGSLFLLTCGVALVALGVLWIVDRTGAGLGADAYFATLLAIVGLGMVAGAVMGNGRRLVPLALILGLALAVSSQVTSWTAGEIVQAPTRAEDLKPTYELAAGRIELDLTGIEDLDALDGRTVKIDVTTGEVVVLVPDGLDMTVSATQAAGEALVLGERGDGFNNDVYVSDEPSDDPDLRLIIDGFAGRVEVSRA